MNTSRTAARCASHAMRHRAQGSWSSFVQTAQRRRAISTSPCVYQPNTTRATYPRPPRALPELKTTSPLLWFALVAGVAGWAGFVMRSTNAERATSSVMRQAVFDIRQSEEVREALGDNVEPILGQFVHAGYPKVQGTMSLLQGKVDISFRVHGSKGNGTVYFTSIRKAKGQPFVILRFRVVCDDGTVVSLREHYEAAPSDVLGAVSDN